MTSACSVPGPSCQPSPTIAPSRTSDRADHGVGRGPAPARARPAPGPGRMKAASCSVTVTLARGAAQAASAPACRAGATGRRLPVLSHPDCHGRSRNPTGSTPGCAGGRGLSPPVGNRTPPRNELSLEVYAGLRGRSAGAPRRFRALRRSTAKEDCRLALGELLHLGRHGDGLAVVANAPPRRRGDADRDREQREGPAGPLPVLDLTLAALEIRGVVQ